MNKEKDEDAVNFWVEFNKIVRNINKENPSRLVYSYNSQIITNYYLWEILKELRKLNGSKETKEDIE